MDWVLAHMGDPDFDDPLPAPAPAVTGDFKAHPESVAMLSSMGFTERQVILNIPENTAAWIRAALLCRPMSRCAAVGSAPPPPFVQALVAFRQHSAGQKGFCGTGCHSFRYGYALLSWRASIRAAHVHRSVAVTDRCPGPEVPECRSSDRF